MTRPTAGEVQTGQIGQRTVRHTEPIDHDRQQLDGPDDQRHRHRHTGDGQVVEDLPHWCGRSPAVRDVHEAAVDGVKQAHAGGEKDRQRQDGVPREAERRCPAREHQQAHLGSSVEAEPERQSNRIHLPRFANRSHRFGKNAGQDTAIDQLGFQRVVAEYLVPHPTKRFDDADQDHQIDDADEIQECARDRGANRVRDILQGRGFGSDWAGQRSYADGEQGREDKDDRGMP